MVTQTDRRNDKPSTVTLAAHARRGLIIVALSIKVHIMNNLLEETGLTPVITKGR